MSDAYAKTLMKILKTVSHRAELSFEDIYEGDIIDDIRDEIRAFKSVISYLLDEIEDHYGRRLDPALINLNELEEFINYKKEKANESN